MFDFIIRCAIRILNMNYEITIVKLCYRQITISTHNITSYLYIQYNDGIKKHTLYSYCSIP